LGAVLAWFGCGAVTTLPIGSLGDAGTTLSLGDAGTAGDALGWEVLEGSPYVSPCLASLPEDGAPCVALWQGGLPGTRCTYGGDPRWACRDSATCDGASWTVSRPWVSCSPLPPCPQEPAEGVSCSPKRASARWEMTCARV